MDPRHRRAIKKNLVNLSTDLDFPALMSHLLAEDIFPEGKLEVFQAITSKPKQNTDFLMDIQRRGPKAFGILIKSLCATHQEHCADWLDPQCEIARPMPPFRQVPHDTGTHSFKVNIQEMRQIRLVKMQVINHGKVKMRDGTNKDCEAIENLFRDQLGFVVKKKQNLNLEEMKQLYCLQEKEDHTNYSCFVSVILSHGEREGVCGVDYNKDQPEVLRTEDFVDVMDHCPTLRGKPKVFFTQACRGTNINKQTTTQLDARRPKEDIEREKREEMERERIRKEREQGDIEKDFKKMNLGENNPRQNNSHVRSDILEAFPTIKDYAAAREVDTGTWYMQSVCELLKKEAHKEDLISVLTKVNNQVGERKGRLGDGSVVLQTCVFHSSLKKKLYFPPVGEKRSVQPSS
ncbi:putative caspase-3 isoform X1 [Apostichopus japonicus]|uniref:Putative caspase-3 isoform X1 n=1 Tax=Stichopus japonicus TaxID=307972 RepID=A0A2G8L4L8_STIJA|nr:putative caspase-3 isoform X1 [Apostichopus japonicus]